MGPQIGFYYVVPRIGKFEFPVPNMQSVNKEEEQEKLNSQQYQRNREKERQSSIQEQPGSKKWDSQQEQEHMSKITVKKLGTNKLRNDSEKRDEFVMKRGNPPHQLERFCPRCPLNAACYTNASEFKNQTTDVKFITRKLAGI